MSGERKKSIEADDRNHGKRKGSEEEENEVEIQSAQEANTEVTALRRSGRRWSQRSIIVLILAQHSRYLVGSLHDGCVPLSTGWEGKMVVVESGVGGTPRASRYQHLQLKKSHQRGPLTPIPRNPSQNTKLTLAKVSI